MMEWISVNDRLPESSVPVLIYFNRCGGDIDLGRYHTSGNMPFWSIGAYQLGYEVTHWMPLPDPPNT